MHHTSSTGVSVVDIFFPGFTGAMAALNQLLNGTLDNFATMLCVCGMLIVGGKFICNTVGGFVDTYLTCRADVHDPDEGYDMLECWVSSQDFAKDARSSLVSVDGRRGRAMYYPDYNTTTKKPLRFTPWRKQLRSSSKRSWTTFAPFSTPILELGMPVAGYYTEEVTCYTVARGLESRALLSALFTDLPQRCVVLLEDVDAVSTTRARDTDNDESDLGSDVSRSLTKSHRSLSLSGLLNVLNGVASQDGRVLIITTNYIKHLDDALIRPGRVDKKIEFGLADAEVIRKLFCTVFEHSEKEMPDAETRDKNNVGVQQLAVKFASVVPELQFSPADILSFLLANRGSPSSALADAEGWLLRTRKAGTLRRCDSWGQSE
ncbi:mitochondrial chaperone bcs1 [Colletotrichum scovillei]|uniref:Mitochondrial chaperone bcs1 n=1 Tax=Colletotrichum scovillei TaxID=1209932 RepID=A0A9P7QSA4_9PEZI|nr:mitochondrial chaperone bcs1 [Colletotrichum scovillei]KAG7040635.1 mitochondrial chaperone bcs1 [Colletotrichum scovillei]KAG7060682.1 mitochondrial chaperone bcs1 [Colletotrichum scovillei]